MDKRVKKVFQQTTVDGLTGELLKDYSVYVSKTGEVFGMYRKTDGLDWLLGLTGNELKLLIILADISDSADGSVSLSKVRREKICNLLGIGSRSLSMLFQELNNKDAIFRINNNDLLVNPATFFRCATNELRQRIQIYNELKLRYK